MSLKNSPDLHFPKILGVASPVQVKDTAFKYAVLQWGENPIKKRTQLARRKVLPCESRFRVYDWRDFLHCRGERKQLMATKTIIKPAKSPAAVGPYNHAVRIGDLLFCAGQIPIDPKDGNLISGDVKAQTERVLENVKAILEDQKLTFANVVKSTVFLTNLGDFAGMNEIYAKYFTNDFPARSTIQVAALPKGANVEIEVIAHF